MEPNNTEVNTQEAALTVTQLKSRREKVIKDIQDVEKRIEEYTKTREQLIAVHLQLQGQMSLLDELMIPVVSK